MCAEDLFHSNEIWLVDREKNLYGDKWSSVIDMSRTVSWLPSTPRLRLVFCLSLSRSALFSSSLLLRFNLSEVILSWTNSVSAHILDDRHHRTTFFFGGEFVRSLIWFLSSPIGTSVEERNREGERERQGEEKSVPAPVNTCRLPIYHWSYHLISHSISSCWDNTKFAFVAISCRMLELSNPSPSMLVWAESFRFQHLANP